MNAQEQNVPAHEKQDNKLTVMTKSLVAFRIDSIPPSIQGKKEKRDGIREKVAGLIAPVPFLFSHDVNVSITLYIDEETHYETDRTPDIDNVIKPMLDAITGPNALLIDDNQVSSVQCNWCDTNSSDGFLEVSVSSMLEEVVEKDGLVFVRIDRQIYFPFNPARWKQHLEAALNQVERLMQVRRALENGGIDRKQARMINPTQRYFHRTRLRGFPLMEIEELRKIARAGSAV